MGRDGLRATGDGRRGVEPESYCSLGARNPRKVQRNALALVLVTAASAVAKGVVTSAAADCVLLLLHLRVAVVTLQIFVAHR